MELKNVRSDSHISKAIVFVATLSLIEQVVVEKIAVLGVFVPVVLL